jgi:hypothetical protein
MNNKVKVLLPIMLFGVSLGLAPISEASSCAVTAQNTTICLNYGEGSGRYFPNGAIIKSNASPKVYYLDNFTKRPVESPALLESRFDWKGLIVTSQEAIDEIPNGANLTFRDGSLLSNRGNVYIISDGLKRPIDSPAAFLRLGFKWENVKAVSDAEIDLHPLGERVTTSSTYPDGVVFKQPGGDTYLVDDGKSRYIPSPLIFESMFRWDEVVDFSFSVVGPAYFVSPKGDVFYPNGLLISGQGKVWIMENNKKVAIGSPEIFESLGLSWGMVRQATPFEMNIIPTNDLGQIGRVNMKFYPDGTLVKADDSPQVYVFDRGNLKPINSPAVFFSYGYSFDRVLTFPRRVINQYGKWQDPLPFNPAQ